MKPFVMRAALLAILAACSPAAKPEAKPEPAPPPPPPVAQTVVAPSASINEFLSHGAPTFVVGTAGDDLSDSGVARQVSMIQTILFPTAPVVLDTAVDRARWPKNATVYGGAHVNSLVASVALPFTLTPGHLEIGGKTFDGDEYQVIAVVPADPQHPEFLLFAGTGTPGVAEINRQSGGAAQITVKDRFGILMTGSWKDGRAVLDAPARRIDWRTVERDGVTLHFPAQLAPAPDETAQIEATLRGITTAGTKLGDRTPPRAAIYFYPDNRSKQTLTGDGGSGHAVVVARALHVVAVAPRDLERLVAHEVTHLRAHDAWGPAGTPLLGEGVAVWVSGFYAGRSLDDWSRAFKSPATIADLLAKFRKLPEADTYPVAGLLVETAIALVGIEAVRTHLYPATSATWDAACSAAGTSPEALQRALDARLAKGTVLK